MVGFLLGALAVVAIVALLIAFGQLSGKPRVQPAVLDKLDAIQGAVDAVHAHSIVSLAGIQGEIAGSHKLLDGQLAGRLDALHAQLGDLRTIGDGVGQLQKILTNVKTRGGFGEVQLAAILADTLTATQYESNVITVPGSNNRVEFAVKLPGPNATVWLPIDAKFPTEDYQRLCDFAEQGNVEGIRTAGVALEARIKLSAKDIKTKYISPPGTTDFAIMFLPSEGLFAEVVRRPGLFDQLRTEQHVVVAGPSTLFAILSSFQMGFRTLAVEQRSLEVWKLLSAVKTEFTNFIESTATLRKRLETALTGVDDLEKRGRAVERNLRDVEQISVMVTLPTNNPDSIRGVRAKALYIDVDNRPKSE